MNYPPRTGHSARDDGRLAGEAGRTGSSPAVFSPTEKQLEILRYITGFIEANGESPTFREMVEGLGYSSTSIPWQLFHYMRGRGLLRRVKGKARAIEILVTVAIPRDPRGEPLQFIKYIPPDLVAKQWSNIHKGVTK